MIKFVDFLQKRNINIQGVLHIGAHMAEEETEYLKLVSGKEKIIWVEANPALVERMNRLDPEKIVKCALITDKDNDVRDFIITSFSQSNSIFELEDHKKIFPWVHETGRQKMVTSTIDTLFFEDVVKKGINMLAMDIQGAELLALKGADKCLHHFDIIYTEINLRHLYKNCALIGELDLFLFEYGFYRAETLVKDNSWGDAIYLKKSLATCLQEGENLDRVWDMLKINTSILFDIGARGSEYPKGNNEQIEYHLFDPNLKHYNDLVDVYGNNPNVFILNLALGDNRSEVSYYPGSESINPRFFGREKIITVSQDTLDNYCAKMDISRINFLKIDTEGHELKVLEGGKKMLDNTDYILFEYGGTYPDAGITFSQVYDLLYSKGFNYIYYIGKNCLLYQPIPVEHKRYSNYLAMRTTWKEACRPLPNLGITCINLERSIHRKEFAVSQLNKLGLPFEFFNAVDGKKIDIIEDGKWVEYLGERFKYNPIVKNGRDKLSYGEIGCFLSHILSARKMLKSNHDYFLLLEDDNEILDINLARRQLMNIPDINFDFCLLSASMNCQLSLKCTINNFFAYPATKKFNRANAILFSRSGLEKIISIFNQSGICIPYDDFLESINLNIIISRKFLYAVNDSRFKSDIWNTYKQDEIYNNISHDKPSFHGKLSANLNSHARLGNCLFQYAFLKSQEIEKGMTIVFPTKCKEFSLLPRINHEIGRISNDIHIEEKKFEYDQEFCNSIKSEQNYFISGYFQSYKYFTKYENVIKDCFQIDSKYKKKALRFLGTQRLCGVHIRLPDTRGETGFIYSTPSEKYLKEAISIIRERNPNIIFLVCSSDIQECEKLYRSIFPENTIFSNMDKNEDFTLLSLCEHNIVTAGTYGWWAAYLNKNPDKIVIGLRPTFNPTVERVRNNNESDYYPPDWIVLNNF